jgi:hypothetical protein
LGRDRWRPMQVSRLLKRLRFECRTMHPFKKKPQMTSEEFKTALREAGLGVAQGWIVDVSGRCPGFASLPSFNKGVLNRNSTLSKVLWEREAEIKRRAKEEG